MVGIFSLSRLWWITGYGRKKFAAAGRTAIVSPGTGSSTSRIAAGTARRDSRELEAAAPAAAGSGCS
jgi:hypothetical protein